MSPAGPPRDLADATVVVTGASSGTGAAAARLLHDLGARVVVVGRDPARTRQLDDPADLSPHRRYARAKLAALLLHREHARRHPRLEVVDFHPGIVATDFGRYLGPISRVVTAVSRPFLTSPREAARRLVHLATTGEAATGRYYSGTRPADPSPLVGDARLAASVWDDARARLAPADPAPR